MKKLFVFFFGIVMIMGVFIVFSPNPYNEIFSFKPLKNMVQNQIKYYGIERVIFNFSVLAPLKEEIIYRGPVWLFCFISFLLGVKDDWQKVIALLILFIPTMVWAALAGGHAYPVFYQGCVFLGGIVSGLFTIYLMDKKIAKLPGWLITLVLPIILHSIFNLCFILAVWKFLL